MYSKSFYKSQSVGSISSAEVIVPYVLERLHVESVVDLGCGVGTWLSVFQKYGVKDVLGIDGIWVDKNRIMIPKEKFRACDLKNIGPEKYRTGREKIRSGNVSGSC